MQELKISLGFSRTAKTWKNTKIEWKELVQRLRKTVRTSETVGEYKNMPKAQQDKIKDVGGFVGGNLIDGIRKAGNVGKRYVITLDADYASEDFEFIVDMKVPYTYCIYSTHKHTPEKPRLRLVIPLSRPVSADEYEAIARLVASDIGIDMFDDTTYQAHRLMYWGSTSHDGEYFFRYKKGDFLDADKYLNRYDNWKDVTEWAVSSRTVAVRKKTLKKQEDPTTKKGIVGAFCRTYDIDDVISTYLSDVYDKCNISGRYTYIGGSSYAGLVVYEDSKFAYSNHATDPANGILCNAFDLVRIHKFIDKDEDAEPDTPTVKLPSYLAMQELASQDKEVKKLLYSERLESAKTDFEDVIEDENTNTDWVTELDVNSKGGTLPTINNSCLILRHDPNLKGKLRHNEFSHRNMVFGAMPWNKDKDTREWVDADDAGLRKYLEKAYDIKNRNAITDAWLLTNMENKYHPVREYLDATKWDGTSRLETLLVDYLGANDNPYVRAVTRKTLVAAVARIDEPGCKFDNMLVLVGKQGCGKSQLVKKLGIDWSSDTLTTVQGKEAYEQIQGFWIIEVAEMSAMKKAEVEAIKHFTSKSEDAYRAAYGRNVEVHKRQCIFIGTTNKKEFLRDMTGNRRFWAVDVEPEKATKNIWLDLTDEVIAQIWAEAKHFYDVGEKLYLDTKKVEDLAEEVQNQHLEESPLTGDIIQYLDMLLPEDWDKKELSERRAYIHGTDFGEVVKNGVKQREKVCIMEIWCELLYGEKKDLTLQKSREIKEIILKTGKWINAKSNLNFGKIYFKQRGFIKK